MANILSSSFVNGTLAGFVANKEYTKFYEALFSNGSTVSALYIPGPTGQGLFGGLSHNQVADRVEDVRRQGFWNQWRPELRESLAHLIGLIMRRAGGDASAALRVSSV